MSVKYKNIVILATCLLFLLSACADFHELRGKDYPHSALLNYKAGIKYLDEENYEISQKYFNLVKTKFTFSLYATKSELLIADVLFRQDMYSEAIDAYKNFQRNHPKNECIPYSQFRISEAYFEQIADDWWFLPPSYERDQKITEKSLRESARFLRIERAEDYYFASKYEPAEITHCSGFDYAQKRAMVYKAKDMLKTSRRRLIDREVYVAKFYLKRDKPNGSVNRLEGLFEKYPDVSAEIDLVMLLAESYTDAHMYKKAKATYEWIAKLHPESDEAKEVNESFENLVKDEEEWKKEVAEQKAEKAPRKKRELEIRKKLGLQTVDPDPDPNTSSEIPLPEEIPAFTI